MFKDFEDTVVKSWRVVVDEDGYHYIELTLADAQTVTLTHDELGFLTMVCEAHETLSRAEETTVDEAANKGSEEPTKPTMNVVKLVKKEEKEDEQDNPS